MEAKEQRGGSEPMAAISYSTQSVMRVSLVSSLHHVYTVGSFMPYYTDVVRHNSSKTQFIRTPVSYSKVLRRGERKL